MKREYDDDDDSEVDDANGKLSRWRTINSLFCAFLDFHDNPES